MKEETIKIKYESATKFRDKDGYYIFPFEVLGKTPGGSNLGRIEWHLEPVASKKKDGRYYIEKLMVWASQTRDTRYFGKVFEIPCWSESLTADSLTKLHIPYNRASYFHFVWRMMICEVHKNPMFSAYPANEHSKLKIDTSSSISCELTFE